METNEITLSGVLPKVFCGPDEKNHASDIWLTDITLRRGQNYLIEAASGTGKSSLCSFIFGNRRDYIGDIKFDGKNIRKFTIADWCEIRRQSIALLPQEMRLFPELTVMENIQIKNRLTDYESEASIHQMLEALEIDNKAASKAAILSIGQQQRVAIVRALCQPFSFIFLDEPVSHLDQRNNRIAAALIKEKAAAQGAAIVSTSVGNQLLLDADVATLHL